MKQAPGEGFWNNPARSENQVNRGGSKGDIASPNGFAASQ
jgi:hypothetical protein